MTRSVGLLARRAFDPASITKSLWLKGDGTYWQNSTRTTSATADGDPVGAWDDASGNNRHAVQATAGKRPVLKTGANGLNGHSIVRFDGTDDFLTAPIDAVTNHRLFVVAKKTAAPGAATDAMIGYGTLGDGQLSTDSSFFGNSNYNYYKNQAGAAQNTGITATTWRILLIRVPSASSIAIRFNGGAAVSSFDPNDAITTATALTLAANNDAGAGPGDYDIAEVIRVGATTVAQDDNLGNYLATKFGLSWAPIA